MKLLQITGYGDIETHLTFNEIEKPTIKTDQVLIEIYAAGVNPIDYKIIEGAMKQLEALAFPAPIGFDLSGIVVDKGTNVKHLNIGDEVYSRVPSDSPGTFSEYIAVDANVVCIKPSNLNFIESSSLPLVGLTTFQSFEKVNLKRGDKVLIHAGSGGIGSFAIQFAQNNGAYVFATTSTGNVSWVKELGADTVIDYKKENYLDIVKDIDIVYDTLGGNYTLDAFKVLKKGGKVTSIAGPLDEETASRFGIPGYKIPEPLEKAIIKNEAIYKFTLMQPNGEQLMLIKQLVENGVIKPIVDKVFPFSESIKALLYQKSGHAKGKIVINVK